MNKKMKQILKEEKFPETSFEIDAIVNEKINPPARRGRIE